MEGEDLEYFLENLLPIYDAQIEKMFENNDVASNPSLGLNVSNYM